MKFNNESEFENHIREIIAKRITSRYPHVYALDNKKAVDVLICRNAPLKPALFFLEVKYHKKSHGRLGFGSKNGGGFQPEIVSKKPDYFETNLRWVIGSEVLDTFLFVTSDEISKYVAGGEVGNKFNNIQKSIFSELIGYHEKEFIKSLIEWILPEEN